MHLSCERAYVNQACRAGPDRQMHAVSLLRVRPFLNQPVTNSQLAHDGAILAGRALPRAPAGKRYRQDSAPTGNRRILSGTTRYSQCQETTCWWSERRPAATNRVRDSGRLRARRRVVPPRCPRTRRAIVRLRKGEAHLASRVTPSYHTSCDSLVACSPAETRPTGLAVLMESLLNRRCHSPP